MTLPIYSCGMFSVPLFRIILKTQSNNNSTITIYPPIYNIPIGKGGAIYNILNLAPMYTPYMGPPALSPYLWGAPPRSVSPLTYVFERRVEGGQSLK